MLKLLSSLQVPGGGKAFDDLTTTKMAKFNAESPDLPDVCFFATTNGHPDVAVDQVLFVWREMRAFGV